MMVLFLLVAAVGILSDALGLSFHLRPSAFFQYLPLKRALLVPSPRLQRSSLPSPQLYLTPLNAFYP